MKIVLNRCYGGYGLSQEALEFMNREDYWNIERTDPSLFDAINILGDKANGRFAKLEIIEIPFYATDYTVEEYDGFETIYYVVNGKIYKI